jgi:type 1 fimbriae regulatory protein FimB/type 1 fimbriae regulatory protein FimE
METQPMLRRLSNDHYRSREHLTWAEVEQLMEAVGSRDRHKLRNQGLVLLSFRHGLRVGEAVRLRRDALMLPAASAYITRLKGSNSGMHPLQPDEVVLLEELLGCYESEYVFSGIQI